MSLQVFFMNFLFQLATMDDIQAVSVTISKINESSQICKYYRHPKHSYWLEGHITNLFINYLLELCLFGNIDITPIEILSWQRNGIFWYVFDLSSPLNASGSLIFIFSQSRFIVPILMFFEYILIIFQLFSVRTI